MKTRLFAVAAAAVLLSAPLASFAQQSNAPLTRAEVRAQLVEAQKAGYTQNDNLTYPADIQAVDAKIAAADTQEQPVKTGYGPAIGGMSQSGVGRAVSNDGMKPTFFGQ
ncbi:DUF4148 domain-containing protein [Trinickia violacea]|uniref:DUF4148 domain-containing protein n=1 Tax=Trinickia violacea TaxID=2571746 RepID=A0A4P8IJG6_9BURK|nr:DUF4148 domain-containing protein [Trinickia violacea]QCP48922.1 DUF4148 domain-containing protein [Trinickia violacea]